ncbi:MAG: NAD(P)-dependent oxidoreductase [Parvularcula sp.]|jgi:phosphoglycerate dehydrogenase-like enzyme|nr:NAD(P)-dependent oxidoreductase [Parvularcula sp.]
MTAPSLIVRVHDKDGAWLAEEIGKLDPRIMVTREPIPRPASAKTCLVTFVPPADEDLTHYDWIHASGAGVDRILPKLECASACPLITRTTGRMGRQIGEYALSYALAYLQRHQTRRQLARQKLWSVDAAKPRVLFDTDVLVIGTGAMGQGIAEVFAPLAKRVIGASRSGRSRPPFTEVYRLDELLEMTNAIVVASLPATPDTEHILNEDLFGRLTAGLFINAGRGVTLDTQALRTWLGAHQDAEAVLDVFEQEPLPETDPLWRQERLTITPHVSGITRAEDTLETFARQVRHFLDNEPLEDIVDPAQGY